MTKAIWGSVLAAVVAISPVTAAHAAPTFTYFADIAGGFGNTAPGMAGQDLAFNDTFTFATTTDLFASFLFGSTGGTASSSPTYLNFTTATINGTTIPVTVTGTGALRTREGGLLDFLLPAGTQTLSLAGTRSGFASYAGSFSLLTVPEASTWAMMIAGFGMVGATMRRKALATRKASLA